MNDLLAGIPAILASVPDWLSALLSLVGAASAVTALTPTPKDDKWLGKTHRILKILALNIGHARPGRAGPWEK